MTDSRHYRAFISYSHSDEQWARWLQRALEKYKLPKTFRQSHPELPDRLYPIFRDRDELASGGELSESIRRAMEDSEALIVICSPAARASLWVNEEIKRFKASGRGDRIFCLLVAGSPDGKSPECAFPAASLQDEHGYVVHEPLAADATPKGDGKRNAMLKIAAGLLNVGVDDLKQRDAQRQARFWSFVALGTTFIAAMTIGLAIYAFNAKKESEMRRQQAEGLIGFMLGDLRKKLEPIGKLDILDAVGDQAMKYFSALGDHGTPKEMLSRAVALKQIGDVRFKQGKLEPALKAFEQALIQSRNLHKAEPGNNEYLFELGQAEFWAGYVAWERGDLSKADDYFQNYMKYSRELQRRGPENSDYTLELAYAFSNLGSLARARGSSKTALDYFEKSNAITLSLIAANPEDTDLIIEAAEGWSWIGSTKRDLGELKGSDQAFSEIEALLNPLIIKSENARPRFTLAANLLHQSRVKMAMGDIMEANALCLKSIEQLSTLTANDPQNSEWRDTYSNAQLFLLSIIPDNDWNVDHQTVLSRLVEEAGEMHRKEPSSTQYLTSYARMRMEKARRDLSNGNTIPAYESIKSAHAMLDDLFKTADFSPLLLIELANSAELLGKVLNAGGDSKAAEQVWLKAAALIDKQSTRIFDYIPIRYKLAVNLSQTAKARELEAILLKAGYRNQQMPIAINTPGNDR